MENKIIKSFGQSIYEPVKDTIIDYAEIEIDNLTEPFISDIAKEIPFVKSVYSIKNVILSVKDRRELKNFLIFFNEIHKNKLSKKVREEHINKLVTKNKKFEDELELLITVLSKIEDDVKNKMIADIYSAYVLEKDIPYFLFVDMIKIIEQMFLTDFFIFGAYYETKNNEQNESDKCNNDNGQSLKCRYIGNLNRYEATISIDRLCRLGLVTMKTNYKLTQLEESEKFIQRTILQTLFPNFEPNILGQTLHSIIIDELNSEFLKPDKRREYGLEE